MISVIPAVMIIAFVVVSFLTNLHANKETEQGQEPDNGSVLCKLGNSFTHMQGQKTVP
jgi:hypothetical protein